MAINIESMMENSICNNCMYKITRTILLYDEDIELNDDNADSDDVNDYIFKHSICLLLDADLDHVVLECTKFFSETKNNKELIRNHKVLFG